MQCPHRLPGWSCFFFLSFNLCRLDLSLQKFVLRHSQCKCPAANIRQCLRSNNTPLLPTALLEISFYSWKKYFFAWMPFVTRLVMGLGVEVLPTGYGSSLVGAFVLLVFRDLRWQHSTEGRAVALHAAYLVGSQAFQRVPRVCHKWPLNAEPGAIPRNLCL